MENYNYSVGLDIGISSVGFAIIDQSNDELIEMGVRHFEKAIEASDARNKRSARRNLRRKNWRKTQLKEAFVDFDLISKEEISTENYALYSAKNDGLVPPKDRTVYHLRSRAIREKVSLRELFLCMYNISQARGHFLLTDVDFEYNKNAINFDLFKTLFYEYTEPFIEYYPDREEFEERVEK